MSNPTSNFNWQMPTAVDLVTDLPADFEVFGQAVDTSLADLKGGTSGQILAKNTNADMDFVWVTNDVGDITAVTAGTGISGGGTSGAVTITNSMATEIAAKGDLIAGTGSQTFDNLTVGANNTVLTADSTTATGLKWAAPAATSGPTFRVYRGTTDQTFSAATSTKVQFNEETWDTDNCFDSTTNYRFTPNKAGYYQISCTLLIFGNSGAEVIMQFRTNNVETALAYDNTMSTLTYQTINADTLQYFNGTTDYADVWAYVSAGSPKIDSAPVYSYFTGIWIRS
jgi:hypothetical protein